MPLTSKQLDELKALLLEEKAEILRTVLETRGEESSLSGDIVDLTTDLTERELRLGLAEHEHERLLEIEEALDRMEDESYGICLESGEEIPYERLKAVPTAKYTVRCQQMLERRRYSHT